MTPDSVAEFVTTGVFAFILVFVRVGTAIMIMPGIGNAFVPANIRLYFALAFTFVIFPILQSRVPNPIPETFTFFTMIMMEFIAGLFLGTVMRILLAAIDIAGMIIATQSSLANAQLFNPSFASQGSIVGAFLTMVAILLLLVTDMHHLMITGIIESYDLILFNQIPPMGDIANIIIQQIGFAFKIAIQMTAPFLIIVTLLNVGMGVMSKVMPQVQVFMLAVPIQVTLSLITLGIIMSTMMLYWLSSYDEGFHIFYKMATQ
jgi:flagellar biosynthetic protein FliR